MDWLLHNLMMCTFIHVYSYSVMLNTGNRYIGHIHQRYHNSK